jgi:hypothetical protein
MSNYTPEMVARITASAPLNLAKAKELAEEFGSVSYRSVISKAQSIGVEYVKLSPVKRAPKADTPTKAEYLAAIRKALALTDRAGDLTKAELSAVLESIRVFLNGYPMGPNVSGRRSRTLDHPKRK